MARSQEAPRLAGRELSEAWEEALEAAGLPLYRPAGRTRGRVAFGAPLQLGIAAEHELLDVFLTEREPIWRIREGIDAHLPAGWRLVDLFDMWVGSPALAGRVVAADYRVELDDGIDPVAIAGAASELLDAGSLPRVRAKGDGSVSYDLRPLLADVSVRIGAPSVVRIRTRIHPEQGSGRPEEVIAALGDRLGRSLTVRSIVRERLVLADDQS